MSVDAEVIHIDFEPLLCDHIGENMVHEYLKRGWGIAKSKEHYGGFKESKGGDERSLPLIGFPNLDVVVPQQMSNLVNRVESFMLSMSSGISGRG